MPYKSQKIKIANTKFDRRLKLDEDDKQVIISAYEKGESMRSLSRRFKVDRQVIKYTIFPEYKEQFFKANRERPKEYDREKNTTVKREHRRYKHNLYKEGKIKLKGEK